MGKVTDKISPDFLQSLGLAGYEHIPPKPAWSKRLQKSMNLANELPPELTSLKTLFHEELKEIIWLSPIDANAEPFASAAYPEVSGKVFLTLAVFTYIPPNLVLDPANPYLAFENMVHECLHHRGENIFTSSSILSPLMKLNQSIKIPWRKTEWAFSHAIQAYYVYLWIARLRQWRIQDLTAEPEFRQALAQSLEDVHLIISQLEEQLSAIAGLTASDFRSLMFIRDL